MKGNISIGTVLFVISLFVFAYSYNLAANAPQVIITENPDTTTPTTITEISYSEFEDSKSIPESATFESEEEFTKFLSTHSSSTYGYYGGIAGGVVMRDIAVMEESATNSIATPKAAIAMDLDDGVAVQATTPGDYSGTNNQVASVDEADIIKTDGSYIYTISDNYIYIIKSYPAEDSEIIFSRKLDQYPTGLFIEDNRMLIIGTVSDYSKLPTSDYRPKNGLTYAHLYDITDKSNPTLIKEQYFEGYYSDARLNNGKIYIVTSLGTTFTSEYPVPILIEDGNIIKTSPKDIYYYSIPYSYPRLTGIQSMDIGTGDIIATKVITTDYSTEIYMSENAIYLTSESRINEYQIEKEIMKDLLDPYLTEDDKVLIKKIEGADSDILSPYEKESKIMQIYMMRAEYIPEDELDDLEDKSEDLAKKKMQEYDYDTYTVIHKIEVDNGELDITATNKVPGTINNQFSMDEKDGILRIATTISPGWWFRQYNDQKQENHVYTLDEDLDPMDSIKGIAEGESIYSTRFIDERLYMVTYRQTDPFFVIDLSNPDDISLMGELKIPGYSRYLHPYDENKIIGIGREGTETGRTQGLKISLYDVTDPENPIEFSKYVADSRNSYSSAEYDHHAVLFSKEKNMLVIPAYSWDYEDNEGYNGAMVFTITEDEIELRGLIDHSDGTTSRYYYGSQVERSLYIEDNLYTKSTSLLRINKIEDLSSVKKIELERPKGTTDIPVY